jgi:hypothetical protein
MRLSGEGTYTLPSKIWTEPYMHFRPYSTSGNSTRLLHRINVLLTEYPSIIRRRLQRPATEQFTFGGVNELCFAALAHFNPLSLSKHEKRATRSPSTAHVRCPEAQYAFELYRCLYKVLEGKVCLHTEFSYTSDGRLDLYLREKRWAIELLKDGDGTKQHVQRFNLGGKYHRWGMIDDHILLDFRTQWPANRNTTGKPTTLVKY